MSKVILTTINRPEVASGTNAINENFRKISEALDNTVSRDGTLPNQMGADLDLNGNDLLNVHSIDTEIFKVDGQDIQVIYGDIVEARDDALAAATQSDASADESQSFAISAETSKNLASQYAFIASTKSELPNVIKYGAKGDGVTDDLVALQSAIDEVASQGGGKVLFPAGRYLISDTLRVHGSVTLQGVSAGDTYNISSGGNRGSEILLSTTVPTARVFTDVGQPATAVGVLDTSTTYTVGVALIGAGNGMEDIAIQSQGQSNGTGAWDILFFTGAATRSSFIRLHIRGYAKKAGWYADATWGAQNTALTNYHLTQYGWTWTPAGSNNEIRIDDCFVLAGNWALYMKGTERTAADGVDNIYSLGGYSDLCAVGNRFTNMPIGTVPNYPLDSGSYYRDLHRNFQNRYWYDCRFSSASGTSVYLDRGQDEFFFGQYSESRADRLTSTAVAFTVDALGAVKTTHEGIWGTGGPFAYRIYLTKTTRIDPIKDLVGIDNSWTTSTGSIKSYAYGYDTSAGRAYILCTQSDFSGSITAGQTITQTAGQSIGMLLYATERAINTFSTGSVGFRVANPQQYGYIGGSGAVFGGNVRSENFETTGSLLNLSSKDNTSLNAENAGQINFYTNRYGTSLIPTTRIRVSDVSLSTYNSHTLGESSRRWGKTWGTDADFSGDVVGKSFRGFHSFGNQAVTIAGGVATVARTSSKVTLDTEGAAATDDLDTITLAGVQDGDTLILHTTSSSRDVVVKHGTGNIFLAGATDKTLNSSGDMIQLIYVTTASSWRQISYSDN